MTVEDVEEGEGAAPTTSMASVVYEIRGVGFKRIGLNTSASEEREVACRMLYEFASNIGTPFLPFVEGELFVSIVISRYFPVYVSPFINAGTFNAIKPLIVHKWHAACRNITSLILPHLFEICVKAPEGAGLALAPRILMEGLKLVMEAAMDVRVVLSAIHIHAVVFTSRLSSIFTVSLSLHRSLTLTHVLHKQRR